MAPGTDDRGQKTEDRQQVRPLKPSENRGFAVEFLTFPDNILLAFVPVLRYNIKIIHNQLLQL